MEKIYSIEGNTAKITIQSKIYPLVTVKKAISNFISDVYIKLEEDDKNINIYLIFKKSDNIEDIVGSFYNELLRESLRYEITKETKNIRELILARALYTTCIEVDNENTTFTESSTNSENKNYDLDDIAVNWFDKNDNKEE